MQKARLLLTMSCVWWPVAAHAAPTCPPSPAPSSLHTAQSLMAWVGVLHPPGPNEPYHLCPVDLQSQYKRGLLFGVSTDDCPNGCTTDRPETVEFLAPWESDTPSMIGTSLQLPDRLARYCIYVPLTPGSSPPPPQFPPGEFEWAPDRSTMAVATSGFPADLAAYHEDLTREQVQFCAPPMTPDNPRLTLFDTSATAPGSSGNDQADHGSVLASLIEELACGGTTCPFNLATRSSLPLSEIAPHPRWSVTDGGHFGSLEWVAQSIERELAEWKSSGEPNLVLNLSLAWHGDWGGDLLRQGQAECERPDVMAVYDALRHARCEGALIISSAGNRTAGGTDGGNMFPGAWSDLRVQPDDCLMDFGIAGAPLDISGSPLVFAVGGVAADGDPILLARAQGLPHLVAYADHVAANGVGPITGSSVATAIVSAEAALRWNQYPSWSADDIMREVWAQSVSTSIDPTGPFASNASWFEPSGVTVTARRVASCQSPASVSLPSWPAASRTIHALTPPSQSPLDTLAPTGGYFPFATPTPTTTVCPSCSLVTGSRLLSYDIRRFAPATPARLALWDTTDLTADPAETFSLGGVLQDVVEIETELVPERAAILFEVDDGGGLVGYLAEVQVE